MTEVKEVEATLDVSLEDHTTPGYDPLFRQAKQQPDGQGQAPTERGADYEVSLEGIPDNEITPNVRAAFLRVMLKYDKVRAQLEQAQARTAFLEAELDHHPVMPVLGRLALYRRLAIASNRMEQSGQVSSVLALRMDGLNDVRRTHGRVMAERLMAEVAERINRHLRETDAIGSLGGYDLGVFLALSDHVAAERKAREVAADIAGYRFGADGERVQVSIAWGMVEFSENLKPERLLALVEDDLLSRFGASQGDLFR